MAGRLAALIAIALAAYARWLRPWHLRWGATDEELAGALPGDRFVPQPQVESTHAVTIDAPPEAVWPWLVQIGQQRAGFYSYAWAENLLGARMRNADRIVPEWQSIAPGDRVWLHPRVSLEVLSVDPGRSIVLADSWAFVLRPLPDARTRFIVRGRGMFRFPDLKLPALNLLYWRGVYEPVHFVMERGMMLGLKRRAEAAHAHSRAARAGMT
jgi:hypothetical protein